MQVAAHAPAGRLRRRTKFTGQLLRPDPAPVLAAVNLHRRPCITQSPSPPSTSDISGVATAVRAPPPHLPCRPPCLCLHHCRWRSPRPAAREGLDLHLQLAMATPTASAPWPLMVAPGKQSTGTCLLLPLPILPYGTSNSICGWIEMQKRRFARKQRSFPPATPTSSAVEVQLEFLSCASLSVVEATDGARNAAASPQRACDGR